MSNKILNKLAGKVAVVTGASKGISSAIHRCHENIGLKHTN